MAYIDIQLDRIAEAQLSSNYAYISTILRTNEAKKLFRKGFADALRPTRALAKTITRRGSQPLGLNRIRKNGPLVQRTSRAYQLIRVRQIKRKIVGARIGFIGSRRAGVRYQQLLGIEYGNVKFSPRNSPIRSAVVLTVKSRVLVREVTKSINKTFARKRAKRISLKARR